MYRIAVSIAPYTGMPEDLWKQCLGFTGNTLAEHEEYNRFKEQASQLLIFNLNERMIRMPHESMSDWLLNIGDDSAEKMQLFHLAVDKN